MAFIIMYIFIFSAGVYYVVKLIKKGFSEFADDDQYYKHGIEASGLELIAKKGQADV